MDKRTVYTEDFGFRSRLEAHTHVVKAEWDRLPKEYVRLWPQHDAFEGIWAVFPLLAAGQPIPDNTRHFPETTALVAAIPGVYTVGFSCLGPHSRLPFHCGEGEDLLRCHLALEIPEPSRLEVADLSLSWTEGKTLVFDDTVRHRSWNESDRKKVILIVDFRKPDELLPEHLRHVDLEFQRRRDAAYYSAMFADWRSRPPGAEAVWP